MFGLFRIKIHRPRRNCDAIQLGHIRNRIYSAAAVVGSSTATLTNVFAAIADTFVITIMSSIVETTPLPTCHQTGRGGAYTISTLSYGLEYLSNGDGACVYC